MNLFDEFFQIIRAASAARIRYAVVGGIAMSFHDEPRFTRDIDLLIHPDDADAMIRVMHGVGYFEASEPFTLTDAGLRLHRFIKTEGEDHLLVDVLFGGDNRHREIVAAATDQPWSEGVVKVARKADLIWLKEQRNSDQDRVDIARLRDDKN